MRPLRARHQSLPVSRESARRRGALDHESRRRRRGSRQPEQTVTLAEGIQLPPAELQTLARDLKRQCGTGGALKDDTVEIQGDQRDAVREALEARGFRVKFKGG